MPLLRGDLVYYVVLALEAAVPLFSEEPDPARDTGCEARHARMRALAAEAMADAGFVADLRETMRAFRHVDKENWPAREADEVRTAGLNPRVSEGRGNPVLTRFPILHHFFCPRRRGVAPLKHRGYPTKTFSPVVTRPMPDLAAEYRTI